jgi:hypothetical protein
VFGLDRPIAVVLVGKCELLIAARLVGPLNQIGPIACFRTIDIEGLPSSGINKAVDLSTDWSLGTVFREGGWHEKEKKNQGNKG